MFFLSWLLYFFFVFLVHNMSVFNSYATMTVAFKSASLYLSGILIVGISFTIDLGIYLHNQLFKGSLVSILMQEKSKEGFLELGNNDQNSNESDYRLPSLIEDLFIKKQNMSNKENNSINKINKVNEKDLGKIDRVDFNHISQDKLILSNNIQISENPNANENISAENRQGMDKTETNMARPPKIKTGASDKFIEKKNLEDENYNNNHQYDKINNNNNDKSLSASNNHLNEDDYMDNSQNVIRIDKINDKNLNSYLSSRGLEKSINSYQFNLHNVENRDRPSDRKKPKINNI